jgi:signal transduction histidine kinase/DNA-binding response OmpR family regulator/ligand-binding sensor domain-containing protein
MHSFNQNHRFILLIILFIGLFVWSPINAYSQIDGYKLFKNYSYKEYDHQSQNWGMVQAKNGLLYVANQGGILEYDGVTWRVINIPQLIVRSLIIDKEGTIYIGGKNEIGYLASDENGTLEYNSLVKHLEKKYKNFSNVWSAHSTANGIYFRTSKFLFYWNYKEMKSFPTPDFFKASFVYNGQLIVQEGERGLLRMEKGGLQPVPGGEAFAGKKIYMMTPYDPGVSHQKMLIGTRTRGFFLYNGNTAEPFMIGAKVVAYLKENKLSHGIRLSSGDFAMGTNRGLIIMDPQGKLIYRFNNFSGLQGDYINSVFQDTQGNLWLCMDIGISKIEYVSPISIHDKRSNLYGIVLSVARHQDELYVGTTKGLYYLKSPSTFRSIAGISGGCWHLLSKEGLLLAATSGGVFQVKKDISQQLSEDPSYVLLVSRQHTGLIWCGTSTGLAALSLENNRWVKEYRYKSINEEVGSLAEDKNGNLWLGNSTGTILKLDFSGDSKEPLIKNYSGKSYGLPTGDIYLAWAAGHIIVVTTKGLFRFDNKRDTFVPDPILGPEFTGGRDSRSVFRLIEDKNKHIWFHSESRNFQAIPGENGSFNIHSVPFLRIPLTQMNAIYPDPDGKTTWFANIDGLFRYDTGIKKNYAHRFQTLVRKVVVNEKQENETLLFNGSGNTFPTIEYKDRNLYFEFAAPFFEVETKTQYQCILEGYDKSWTTWSQETEQYYTNLDSGFYTFRVRAKNIYRRIGKEAAFRFKILSPWYNTWWAISLYILLILGLMLQVIKWRSGRLEREKQRLEGEVIARTREVYEKNELLEEQSQKLKEMDQVKSRFFANISHEFRTPLTLIMGPLENMLANTNDTKLLEDIGMMLKNSQRLLRLINQLLDLSRFDSGKMKLKASPQDIISFLKGIVASFQPLIQQNKLDLVFDSDVDTVILYFDTRKLEDAFTNLLINASKFTPPGGNIRVSIKVIEKPKEIDGIEHPGYAEISVRDTGKGISKEQLVHIFERFFQVESDKGSDHNGTGIGLALVKELVALHRGQLDVHSTEGQGTEFIIRLPIGHKHLKPDEIVVSPGAREQENKNKDVGEFYSTTAMEDDLKKVEESVADKNVILVVEDNADVRKYIRGPLVESGYAVVEAADGEEGIKKAGEIIPDLIVSDIMMPKVDGFQLSENLRKDIKTSHIPIILLTAKASEDNIIQGLETGADDYITKPFKMTILLSRIKNLIELRRQFQQKIQKQMLLQPGEISVTSMDREFIDELQDIIEKNLADPEFNVEVLSDKMYLDRSTLYRKIKALTGESAIQFIRSFRLKRAAQLLRDKFGNVSQVSLEVGFSNTAYFAECFKKQFQQSPSNYQDSQSE